MFKQTALITWKPDSSPDARQSLLDRAHAMVAADLSLFAQTVPASHRGGDIVWHLHFPDRTTWELSAANRALDMLTADSLTASVDAVAYEPYRHATAQPSLRSGIYRTLFVNIAPAATAADVRQFEDELAGMPDHIPEILNWAINATVASRGGEAPWTHVWEQEFADIGGLTGSYMTSPYHWAYVDRWFDPEMPGRIVDDTLLRHSASVLEESVMALY